MPCRDSRTKLTTDAYEKAALGRECGRGPAADPGAAAVCAKAAGSRGGQQTE